MTGIRTATQPPATTAPAPRGASRLLIAPIRGYQRWISPVLPPTCRFYPSCSQYAVESLRVHGAVRGTAYTLIRLAKCGPWHRGGIDHVKPARPRRTTRSAVGSPDSASRPDATTEPHGAPRAAEWPTGAEHPTPERHES